MNVFNLADLLSGPQQKTDRVMKAVMQVKKLDLEKMQSAAAGKS